MKAEKCPASLSTSLLAAMKPCRHNCMDGFCTPFVICIASPHQSYLCLLNSALWSRQASLQAFSSLRHGHYFIKNCLPVSKRMQTSSSLVKANRLIQSSHAPASKAQPCDRTGMIKQHPCDSVCPNLWQAITGWHIHGCLEQPEDAGPPGSEDHTCRSRLPCQSTGTPAAVHPCCSSAQPLCPAPAVSLGLRQHKQEAWYEWQPRFTSGGLDMQ